MSTDRTVTSFPQLSYGRQDLALHFTFSLFHSLAICSGNWTTGNYQGQRENQSLKVFAAVSLMLLVVVVVSFVSATR